MHIGLLAHARQLANISYRDSSNCGAGRVGCPACGCRPSPPVTRVRLPGERRRAPHPRPWRRPPDRGLHGAAGLLQGTGIDAAPRRAGPSWRQFLIAQARGIFAADFVHVDTVLLRRVYALIVIEHGTRRAHLAGIRAPWSSGTDSPRACAAYRPGRPGTGSTSSPAPTTWARTATWRPSKPTAMPGPGSSCSSCAGSGPRGTFPTRAGTTTSPARPSCRASSLAVTAPIPGSTSAPASLAESAPGGAPLGPPGGLVG